MIKFKKYINNKGDRFISVFAPNSMGKTLFAESYISINDFSYYVINRSSINNILSTRVDKIPQVKQSDDFLFNQNVNLRIEAKNLVKINNFLERFNIVVSLGSENFNSIKLKKGNSFVVLNQTNEAEIKKKLKISSSEYEFLMFCLFYFSSYEKDTLFIFDDPIEMASFENEWWFNEVISLNFKRVMILTHRFTLFQKFPSLHKRINCLNHFYFLDGIPYKLESRSSTYFDIDLFPEVICKNKMYERDVRERVESNIKSIHDINCNSAKSFLAENKKIINKIGSEKPFDENYIDNLFSKKLPLALSSKRDLFNNIRQEIINQYNRKTSKSILKLSKIKKEDIMKKNANKKEVNFIFMSLNASNHWNEWKMYNEISTPKLIRMIEKNIILRGNLGNIIKAAKNKYDNIYENIHQINEAHT